MTIFHLRLGLLVQLRWNKNVIIFIISQRYRYNYKKYLQFTNPATYMNLLNTIASLVAMWGLSVTFRFSAPLLQHTHVKPKFICMQFINVFHNIQRFIISIMIISGVFPCDDMLDSAAVGLRECYEYSVIIIIINAIPIHHRHLYHHYATPIVY